MPRLGSGARATLTIMGLLDIFFFSPGKKPIWEDANDINAARCQSAEPYYRCAF